ncbi:MAG: MFS transporter, partial [Jannaschia sp.]
VQRLLRDESRATFLSLKSLAGRILFAGTLWLAAQSTTTVGQMPDADVRRVMATYAIGGLCALIALSLAARRLRI